MRNPWVRKNPLLSAWLSAANTMTGVARGYASAEMHRQMAAAQAEMTRQAIDFWSGKAGAPVRKRKRRR